MQIEYRIIRTINEQTIEGGWVDYEWTKLDNFLQANYDNDSLNGTKVEFRVKEAQ